MPKKEIIDLFTRNPTRMNSWLCSYYPLTESLISKHKDAVSWSALSSNENFKWTEAFIEKYNSKLSWNSALPKNASLPWSIDFISTHYKKFESKNEISENSGLPWSYDFIKFFKDKWNWHLLVINESIQWTEKMFVDFNLFDQNLSLINGNNLWTEEFILKYKDKFNWAHLCYNPNLPWSEKLIDNLKSTWKASERKTNKWSVSPWKGLSENKNIPWSKTFIKKYQPIPLIKPNGLSWNSLSRNESLPWKDNLLEDFSSKWDWRLLSGNNGVGFTMEQIEKYKEKIFWESNDSGYHTIAQNTSLPWSEELIDKYFEKWHWWGLAMNTGITWSEAIIEKYSKMLDNYPLFRNPSLPWAFDFIIKYEQACISTWNAECGEISEIVWNKVFKPLLNDELVDEILSSISNPHLLMQKIKETENKESDSDPLKKLAKTILSLKINTNQNTEQDKTISSVLNKVKICIVKIANSSDDDHINDYTFLDEYYSADSITLNALLTQAMKPIKDAIIECFDNEITDAKYVRGVIKEQNPILSLSSCWNPKERRIVGRNGFP